MKKTIDYLDCVTRYLFERSKDLYYWVFTVLVFLFVLLPQEIKTFFLFYRWGTLSLHRSVQMWFTTVRNSAVPTRILFKKSGRKILGEILTMGPCGNRKIDEGKRRILRKYKITDAMLDTNFAYRRNLYIQAVDQLFSQKMLTRLIQIAAETKLPFSFNARTTISNSDVREFFKKVKKTSFGFEVMVIYFTMYALWRNNDPLCFSANNEYQKKLQRYHQTQGVLKSA